MEENKKYKYDAFISYRHCDLDQFVAKNLHRILETYDLPRNIKKKLNIVGKPFKRIFRDQEELPLSSNLEDPIIEALKDSKYLIVICSPRLKDSLWCKKEIETFKKLRGRKNIFCILIEGEPSDSFPEEVLYDEIETETKDGKIKKETILVEPLAADVRGESKKEVLKKIKEEKLRLVAPMYNLDYDDLKQRHKIRKQKKIVAALIGITIFSVLFTAYSLFLFIKIESQQNVLSEYHALSLVDQSEDSLKKDDRYNAVKLSYQALTTFHDINMPYTTDAEYQLVESLGVYDVGSSYKAITQLKTSGIAEYLKNSNDKKYGLVYDGSGNITLFKTKNLETIQKYDVKENYTGEHSFTFIGNDMFAYINNDNNISIININDQKEVKELENPGGKDSDTYYALFGEKTGEYLIYSNEDKLIVYNIKEDKELASFTSKDKMSNDVYFSEDSKYLFYGTIVENFNFDKDDSMTIHVVELSTGKEINSVEENTGYISGITTKGNNAYFLLNRTVGSNYNTFIVSYNYLNGTTNWSKTLDNVWGKILIKSYSEEANSIAIASYDKLFVINTNDGSIIETFNTGNEIIEAYSYLDKEVYLLFLSNGSVNFVNMKTKTNIEYKGEFEFNLEIYTEVALSENGFLLLPFNENRVILYERKSNEDKKEVEFEEEYYDDFITTYDEIKEEYKVKNNSLVERMFYDKKQKFLFVNYANNDLAIYRTSDKKLIKTIENLGKVETYYGKDKDGRIYIGDFTDSYILNTDYDKVGHIKNLRKVDKDKIIVENDEKYYSIKLYSLDELLNMAKKYLNN